MRYYEILYEELGQLQELYPDFRQEVSNDLIVLKGKIAFCLLDSKTGKPPITDAYSVEITVFNDFPESIPTVREIAGKIKKPYEHVSQNGVLCLGIPSELYLLLKKCPTIQGFIETIVKPTLFAHSFYRRYGYMPWGDRPAGRNGIFMRYVELFRTLDVSGILALFRIVFEGDYKGNSQCPCGSRKTLNECHGEAIYSLWQVPWNYLIADYYALKDFEWRIDTVSKIYSKYRIL
jgi:hypothetical protein